MDIDQTSTESTIISALNSLTSPQLSDLIHSISALFHLLRRRLHSILTVPTLFHLTLHHLQSLSLQDKSLLIARHLLSNLTILINNSGHRRTNPMKLRDLDAVVLLLLLCELRQLYPEILELHHPSHWRRVISNYVSDKILNFSHGIEASNSEILIKFVEMVTKCKRFVNAMCGNNYGRKERREVATSVAVVVALPSVEVSCRPECVICKEEMKEGRDVCKLPCEHLFHWMCILPWLTKRNTCPCCRHRLPTDDVYGEIERLWELLANMGNGSKT